MQINFAIINKPEKFLSHQNKINNAPSVLDFIKSHFGKQANIIHRLDYETSGLLLCAINKKSEIFLKTLLQNRKIKKQYMALLNGKITNTLLVKSNIIFNNKTYNLSIKGENKDVKIEILNMPTIKKYMEKSNFSSLESLSIISPIKNYKNKTLVKMVPLTGRTHQLRLHALAINAPICGDVLYGANEKISALFMDLKILAMKNFLEKIENKKSENVEIENAVKNKFMPCQDIELKNIVCKNNVLNHKMQNDNIENMPELPDQNIILEANIILDEKIKNMAVFKELNNIAKIENLNSFNAVRKALFGANRLMLHSRKITLLSRSFIKDIDFTKYDS